MIEWIALTVSLASLALVYLRFRADHERQKKQATIEFVASLRSEQTDAREMLLKHLGNDVISTDKALELRKGDKAGEETAVTIVRTIRFYLNGLEYMAVGVNAGVYDRELVRRLMGYSLKKTWSRYGDYIGAVRNEGNENTYRELERLAVWITDQGVTKGGDIKYST